MKGCEKDIIAEALSKWPNEMVGYIKSGKFTPLENVSKEPHKRYQLSIKDKLYILSQNIDYLVHSHPVLDNNPSKADLVAQSTTKIPFLIIGTDGVSTTKIKEVS